MGVLLLLAACYLQLAIPLHAAPNPRAKIAEQLTQAPPSRSFDSVVAMDRTAGATYKRQW